MVWQAFSLEELAIPIYEIGAQTQKDAEAFLERAFREADRAGKLIDRTLDDPKFDQHCRNVLAYVDDLYVHIA